MSDRPIFDAERAKDNDFVKIAHRADDIDYAGIGVGVPDVGTSITDIVISGGKCQS